MDKNGNLIASAQPDDYPSPPTSIEDFNPAESGSSTWQEGDYHGYFEEDVLTVIAPVTQGFSIKGYLLIHKPLSDISPRLDMFMRDVYKIQP